MMSIYIVLVDWEQGLYIFGETFCITNKADIYRHALSK